MKKIALIVSLLLITTFSKAQEFTITGKVIDSITNSPIEFATIAFKDGKTINGTTTDQFGKFTYKVKSGKYTIEIGFISYQTKSFTQKDIHSDISLGTIVLSLKSELLEEIALVADQKLLEYSIDKKIYDASKDKANKGETALGVLNNTPSVRVDDNGIISIRGLSASILIDGKPIFDLDNNSDILKAIPANTIDKVEIITRSSKYSAGKEGGLLNIITKKQRANQTNGSINTHLGSPEDNGVSIFINDKTKSINLYSTISFNNSVKIKNTTLKQDILDNSQAIFNQFRQDSYKRNQKNSLLFSLGSDFYINKNNTFTTSLLIRTDDKNYISDYLLKDANPLRNATKDIGSFGNTTYLELFLNYTTILDTLGQQLSIDFKYNNTSSKNETDIIENVLPPLTDVIKQKSEKDQNLDYLLFKIDYELPLNKDKKLEFGYKGTMRKFKNDYTVSQFDTTLDAFVPLTNLDGKINYNEQIHALYGLYKASYEKLSYNLGVRAELTDISLVTQSITNEIPKNYIDLFPSATLSYEFKNGDYISIDYHRGLKRPTIVQLNPFLSIGNEHLQYTGNPELNSSYNHYFEFLYVKEFKKLSLSSSLFLNFTKDNIVSTIFQNGQNINGQHIFIRKPINNGDKNIIGFDVNLNYRPSKLLRVGTYISPYNLSITNTSNQQYDFNSWVIYTNNYILFSVNNGLRFRINYIYQSKIQDKLTTWRAISFANFSISKSLFKKKATLNFKVIDVFNSKLFSETSNEANTFTARDYLYKQKFLLSFTYRFKQKRRNSKDRNKDINKDNLENRQDEKM